MKQKVSTAEEKCQTFMEETRGRLEYEKNEEIAVAKALWEEERSELNNKIDDLANRLEENQR